MGSQQCDQVNIVGHDHTNALLTPVDCY